MENGQKQSEVIVGMLAKQLNKKLSDVTLEMRIREDLNADSLDVVELIMNIEDKYGITVPDEAALEIKTVADLVKFVEKFK